MSEKVIWKYKLERGTVIELVTIPAAWEFLSVIEQNDIPVLYALVDPTAREETIQIYVRGTGDPGPPPNYVFLGTIQMNSGNVVLHIFVPIR